MNKFKVWHNKDERWLSTDDLIVDIAVSQCGGFVYELYFDPADSWWKTYKIGEDVMVYTY